MHTRLRESSEKGRLERADGSEEHERMIADASLRVPGLFALFGKDGSVVNKQLGVVFSGFSLLRKRSGKAVVQLVLV